MKEICSQMGLKTGNIVMTVSEFQARGMARGQEGVGT